MRYNAYILAAALAGLAGTAGAWWGPPPYPPPGYGFSPPAPAIKRPRIDLEPSVTEQGYRVLVHLTELSPADITVAVEFGRLVVHTGGTEAVEHREPGSYAYHRSHKRAERTLSLPPDADTQAMTRVDGDGVVELLIPRRP